MKKYIYFLITFISIGLLAGLACKNPDDYEVYAVVDGDDWYSDDYVLAEKVDSFIVIEAYSTLRPKIILKISTFDSLNTYDLGGNYNTFLFGTDSITGYSAYPHNPGTLTITKIDTFSNTIAGTFTLYALKSFTDSIRIELGRFEVVFNE